MYSIKIKLLFPYWMNTGGSTGEPLHFPVSCNYEESHQRWIYKSMGYERGDKIATIGGIRIGKAYREKNIYWKAEGQNLSYGALFFSTLYLNENTCIYYYTHINDVKPKILRGYPSGFLLLANYILKNKLSFSYKIKGIYLTAEFFDNMMSDIIQKAFCCPVYGQYGHSEVCVFGITEKNSLSYKCSPIYGFTEILDDNGNHVKENEIGEIVVTGFSNKAMPFIRYKTGDMALYGGTKKGFVILKTILGRSVDYIVNTERKKIYLVGLIFAGHIQAFNNIKSWQIEQRFPGIISVRIVKDVLFGKSDEREISDLFASVNIKIKVEYTDTIPLTERGKKRFMIQHLNDVS